MPRCTIHCALGVGASASVHGCRDAGGDAAICWAQFEDDVLSGAVHRQDGAACKSFDLARWRCFEGLRMAGKPGLDNAIAANALVNAASDRLHLRQFRHRFIVEDCRSQAG